MGAVSNKTVKLLLKLAIWKNLRQEHTIHVLDRRVELLDGSVATNQTCVYHSLLADEAKGRYLKLYE